MASPQKRSISHPPMPPRTDALLRKKSTLASWRGPSSQATGSSANSNAADAGAALWNSCCSPAKPGLRALTTLGAPKVSAASCPEMGVSAGTSPSSAWHAKATALAPPLLCPQTTITRGAASPAGYSGRLALHRGPETAVNVQGTSLDFRLLADWPERRWDNTAQLECTVFNPVVDFPSATTEDDEQCLPGASDSPSEVAALPLGGLLHVQHLRSWGQVTVLLAVNPLREARRRGAQLLAPWGRHHAQRHSLLQQPEPFCGGGCPQAVSSHGRWGGCQHCSGCRGPRAAPVQLAQPLHSRSRRSGGSPRCTGKHGAPQRLQVCPAQHRNQQCCPAQPLRELLDAAQLPSSESGVYCAHRDGKLCDTNQTKRRQ
eukprot:TRINITY_DN22747_c0_g1_i1.p2 TRINITY_DN22747_c0_g1~~TRINITY_DN22747_c0_g1_i1.p2  ORF type:complete len:373 (-),score=24.77 TRINITY_DN22747_c0_g1_i1:22-1140(-)